MKKILLIGFLCFFTRWGYAEDVYLFSFPRSGSEWMMYFIQYTSQRVWINDLQDLIYEPLKKNVNKQLPPYYRSHLIKGDGLFLDDKENGERWNPQKDKLLILVRNYRECTMRHLERKVADVKRELEDKNSAYYRVLQTYDDWNADRRLLIYYEDLIAQPGIEFEKVTRFLELSDTRYKAFMNAYEAHKKVSFKLKKKKACATPTKGRSENYYSAQLKPQTCINLDAVVKKVCPHLYETYLLRYEYKLK